MTVDPEYADVAEDGQLALGVPGEQRTLDGLAPRIRCERCGLGPEADGFPPIITASAAIDLGWTRTASGLLDEECASDVLANDYPRGC